MMRIHRRIDETVEDPATAEALKPWYMIMCKRPCFHNDYLPTFNLPERPPRRHQRRGDHEDRADGAGCSRARRTSSTCLIYATGFEVQKTGIYNRIIGEDGLELNDKYAEGIRTLLGIHSHGYPNLFIMGGYQASFQFNLTDMLQVQGEHIADCIDYVRRNGFETIDCTRARPRSGGCRRSSPTAARPTATPSARPATTTSRASPEPPPGRQLQRRVRHLHRPHREHPGVAAGPLRLHRRLTHPSVDGRPSAERSESGRGTLR